MLLIGSRALAFWNPDFRCRKGSDWDIITTGNIPSGKQRVELHDSHSLNNKKKYYMLIPLTSVLK